MSSKMKNYAFAIGGALLASMAVTGAKAGPMQVAGADAVALPHATEAVHWRGYGYCPPRRHVRYVRPAYRYYRPAAYAYRAPTYYTYSYPSYSYYPTYSYYPSYSYPSYSYSYPSYSYGYYPRYRGWGGSGLSVGFGGFGGFGHRHRHWW